jgi:hypothetical protein
MDQPSKYNVPMTVLDAVQVAPDEQVQEQDGDGIHEYLTAAELDRALLLSPTGAGKLRL